MSSEAPVPYREEQLFFELQSGRIECSFFVPAHGGDKIAVVLPGANYSIRQPLLHFLIQGLIAKGFSVLAVLKLYAEDSAWLELRGKSAALDYIARDSVELFRSIGKIFPDRTQVVVARSIGCYALSTALTADSVRPKQIIWQNPALYSNWPVIRSCNVPGLAILGKADPLFTLAEESKPIDSIVIEGADHSMEIDLEPLRSIEILRYVTSRTLDWISYPSP